jgi:tetratricopeptide (TPR) repeat protein
MRRVTHPLVRVASVVAVGLLLPGLVFAQASPAIDPSRRAQAAQRFEEGSTAFDRGDFAHAADVFERAYRLAPNADSLWNAARARQLADELPRAATLYARYLRETPADARDRNVATALLVTLAARLGRIEVHGGDIEQLMVDELPSDERVIYVSPGAHVVRALVAGALLQQTPVLRPGDVIGLVFEAPAPVVSAEPERAQQPDRPIPETLATSLPSRSGGLSPWFVAGGGVLTGVAVAATIASGLSTLSARDAFNASPTASNLATGQLMQARTNVLLGISIGLGVMTTATAIWLVEWRGPAHGGVRLGVDLNRVDAEWRF